MANDTIDPQQFSRLANALQQALSLARQIGPHFRDLHIAVERAADAARQLHGENGRTS